MSPFHLDDTHPLVCHIESTHDVNGHTEYTIRCHRGFSTESSTSWRVTRRYSDFVGLNSALRSALPLPKKKFLGNMSPDFVAERRNQLQLYLDALLNNAALSSSFLVKNFLDPIHYPAALNDFAVQNASMALRGEGSFELKVPLDKIGWRVRKQHFSVKRIEDGADFFMSWQTYGPDKILSEKDMKYVLKFFKKIEHPYLDKIFCIHNLETGMYTVRNLHLEGSLKDHIYGANYNASYLNKYFNPKQKKSFTVGHITHFAFQILDVLNFLHVNGMPYGHLHTGNIIIANQKILLTDIENSILGVPPKLRHLLVRNKKIFKMEDVDIYCFGHVLYELAYGESLEETTCTSFPNHSSGDLISLMKMILSPASCKSGMPKIESLLKHSLFSELYLSYNSLTRAKFKCSPQLKEHLQNVSNKIEQRLRADQRMFQIESKKLKIKEILNSEEEIEKRTIKMKIKNTNDSSVPVKNFKSNLSSPNDRSESTASSLSDSCYNLAETKTTCENIAPVTSEVTQGRSMLLNSICSFNKSHLNKVQLP